MELFITTHTIHLFRPTPIPALQMMNVHLIMQYPAEAMLQKVAFGTPKIFRSYTVPNITGYYYLVLIADPQNALNDVNRQNNVFYTTGQLPAAFSNGFPNKYEPSTPAIIHDSIKNDLEVNLNNLRLSKFNTSIGEKNRNAYTPQEILQFVKAKYQSGEIRQKINAMHSIHSLKLPQVH